MPSSDMEIGVTHRFKAEGYDKMLSTKKAFDALSESAERFAVVSMQLGATGATVAAIGYTFASPLLYLKNVLMTVGLEFENMNVQMLGLMDGNQRRADSYFSFLRNASEEIPYSFKEAVSAMKEFTFMGIDIKKQYDVRTVTDGIVKNSITGIQAISGLAAASGTSLSTIGHDLQLAITQGRADYLSHWIGPLKAQAMQMSGVFIGTWQQQWDKAIKWIGDSYAQESSNLARTYSGLLTGVTDMIERLQGGLLGLNSTSSAFSKLRVELGKAYDKWREFLTPANSKYSDGLSDSIHKLSSMLSSILMPSIQAAAKAVGFLTEKTIQLIKWATSDKMRDTIISWGRIGLAGSILIAVGAFITLTGVAVHALVTLMSFVGVFTALGSIFTAAFWGPVAALSAGLLIVERIFFNAEGSLTNFVERLRIGFEAVGALFKVLFQTWENATPGGVSRVSTAAWNKLSDYWKNKVFDFLDLTDKIKFDHKKFKAFIDKELLHVALGTLTLAIGSWAIGKLWKRGKEAVGLGGVGEMGTLSNPMYVIVVGSSGASGGILGGAAAGAMAPKALALSALLWLKTPVAMAGLTSISLAIIPGILATLAVAKLMHPKDTVAHYWEDVKTDVTGALPMLGDTLRGLNDSIAALAKSTADRATNTGDNHFHYHAPANTAGWKRDDYIKDFFKQAKSEGLNLDYE